MEAVRLRNYRSYGADGKSWIEMKCNDKDRVIVALIIGSEPKNVTDDSQFIDIDEVILRAADHIRAQRTSLKKRKG